MCNLKPEVMRGSQVVDLAASRNTEVAKLNGKHPYLVNLHLCHATPKLIIYLVISSVLMPSTDNSHDSCVLDDGGAGHMGPADLQFTGSSKTSGKASPRAARLTGHQSLAIKAPIHHQYG